MQYGTKMKKVVIPGTVMNFSANIWISCGASLTSIIYTGTIHPTNCSVNMFGGSKITKVIVPTNFDETKTDFCGMTLSRELTIGKVGDNVEYVLEADGTLLIYGNGPMYERDWSNVFEVKATIKNVIIHEGVTHIGKMTFFSTKVRNYFKNYSEF